MLSKKNMFSDTVSEMKEMINNLKDNLKINVSEKEISELSKNLYSVIYIPNTHSLGCFPTPELAAIEMGMSSFDTLFKSTSNNKELIRAKNILLDTIGGNLTITFERNLILYTVAAFDRSLFVYPDNNAELDKLIASSIVNKYNDYMSVDDIVFNKICANRGNYSGTDEYISIFEPRVLQKYTLLLSNLFIYMATNYATNGYGYHGIQDSDKVKMISSINDELGFQYDHSDPLAFYTSLETFTLPEMHLYARNVVPLIKVYYYQYVSYLKFIYNLYGGDIKITDDDEWVPF